MSYLQADELRRYRILSCHYYVSDKHHEIDPFGEEMFRLMAGYLPSETPGSLRCAITRTQPPLWMVAALYENARWTPAEIEQMTPCGDLYCMLADGVYWRFIDADEDPAPWKLDLLLFAWPLYSREMRRLIMKWANGLPLTGAALRTFSAEASGELADIDDGWDAE